MRWRASSVKVWCGRPQRSNQSTKRFAGHMNARAASEHLQANPAPELRHHESGRNNTCQSGQHPLDKIPFHSRQSRIGPKLRRKSARSDRLEYREHHGNRRRSECSHIDRAGRWRGSPRGLPATNDHRENRGKRDRQTQLDEDRVSHASEMVRWFGRASASAGCRRDALTEAVLAASAPAFQQNPSGRSFQNPPPVARQPGCRIPRRILRRSDEIPPLDVALGPGLEMGEMPDRRGVRWVNANCAEAAFVSHGACPRDFPLPDRSVC